MQRGESAEETNLPEIAVVGEGDRQRRRFMNAGRLEDAKLKSLVERKCKNERK